MVFTSPLPPVELSDFSITERLFQAWKPVRTPTS
jgi:hypothetical protein